MTRSYVFDPDSLGQIADRITAMRVGQGRARPARQQWLGTAARSTRTAAMQGPEEMGGEGLVPLAGGLLVVAGT